MIGRALTIIVAAFFLVAPTVSLVEQDVATVSGVYRTHDAGLASRSQTHAEAMAASNSLWHSSLNAGEGEVVGWNSGYEDPAMAVALGWKNSPDHWAIISDPDYTRIGCGVAHLVTSTLDRWYFSCLVAIPATAPPPTTNPTPTRPNPPRVPASTPHLLPNTSFERPMDS